MNSQANGDVSLNISGSVRVYYSKELKYIPLCLQPNSTVNNIANTVCKQLGYAKAQRYEYIDVKLLNCHHISLPVDLNIHHLLIASALI